MSPFRQFLLLPLLAAALVTSAGCDFSEDDDPIFVDSDIVYVDFSLDSDDYVLNSEGLVATFESSDIDDDDEREAVEDALAGADEGALVLLYVEGSLLFGDGAEDTWAALPVTQAYEAVGDDGVPYVDYTVTYSYSYGDSDLYLDALSSAVLDFDTIFPEDRIDFRLVAAPASRAVALAGVNLRDYEAVRQAFALPE
jgi:hypothetical protein